MATMNTVMHNYPTALRLKTVLTVRSRLLSSLPPKNMLQRRWCTTSTGRLVKSAVLKGLFSLFLSLKGVFAKNEKG